MQSQSLRQLAILCLIVVLGLAAAGRGMSDIPLDSHEIYVAQTAENMRASGDWLVPRLNGEYRLTKPPLSYWLVAGASVLAGQNEISPAIARLPSVLASVGIALLAVWLGTRLFDRRVGLLAGLLCVASFSVFKYGHNARPDMLYAFWTTAVFAAWVGLCQATPGRERRWAYGLWTLFALATLTKGPQAPAILLAGVIVHEGCFGSGWRAQWQRLHPIAGIAILAVLIVPWYLLLRAAIGPETLGNSQLSGSLLSVSAGRLLSPFYWVRTPMLWLPWALLLPAGAIQVWRDRRGPSGLLAFSVLVAVVVFTLGPQYREIYMLPWLAPAMIVFAAAVVHVPIARICLAVLCALVAVALGWLLYKGGLAALASAVVAAVVLVAAARSLRRGRLLGAAGLVAAAFAIGLFQAGAMPSLWSSARYAQLAFSHRLAATIEADTPVVVWDIDPAHYSYYLDRPARGYEALAAVCEWLDRPHPRSVLVYPQQRRDELTARLRLTPVLGARDSEFQASWVPANQGCHPPDTGA